MREDCAKWEVSQQVAFVFILVSMDYPRKGRAPRAAGGKLAIALKKKRGEFSYFFQGNGKNYNDQTMVLLHTLILIMGGGVSGNLYP
jgi:hypothetical protein